MPPNGQSAPLAPAATGAVPAASAPAASQPAAAPTAAASQPASPTLVRITEPAPGDHWTYEIKDEISGEIKSTRTDLVTDIAKNTIGVRSDVTGSPNSIMMIYDPSWNVVRGGVFRYSPNDGTGIHSPLSVGEQWKFTSNYLNSGEGSTWRRTGTSRVSGQQNITTKAGTFDTFVIETKLTNKNTRAPTIGGEFSIRTWYSPDIDHWVKRTTIIRRSGHIFQNTSVELIGYGRKTN